MILGAIVFDAKVANHFANVANFYIVELWQVAEHLLVEAHNPAVRSSAHTEPLGAVL